MTKVLSNVRVSMKEQKNENYGYMLSVNDIII